MEPQVVTVVLEGLSSGFSKFVLALPRSKSRVGIFFFFLPSQSVGMQVFHYRVDMILLDIFLRWRNEWGMHSCFSPRPNGRLFSDVTH